MQAARLLNITYDATDPAKLDFLGRLNEARPPKNPGRGAKKVRGDLDAALARGTVTVDNTYITPLQNHNPMEPHTTLAWWEGEKALRLRLHPIHHRRPRDARQHLQPPG